MRRTIFVTLAWGVCLGWGTASALGASEWHCEANEWGEEPRFANGTFEAAVRAQCVLPEGFLLNADLTTAVEAIRERMMRERTVHGAGIPIVVNGLAGQTFDVTHDLSEEGQALSVREYIDLVHNGADRFVLQTRSQEIQGRGMAAYLRRADLIIQLERTQEHWVARLLNRIAVAKPWYAPAFVFTPVARGAARDKFEKLKSKVLPELSSVLEGRTR